MLCVMFNTGWMPGRDSFLNLMRRHGLMQKPRRSRSTTNSNHRYHKWKNLIKGFKPTAANQLWQSDITYIDHADGCCYLHLVTDAYSKKIVGWKLADNLFTVNAVAALRMAIKQCESTRGLIHHSDRGTQYCASKYISLLKKHGIMPSMTENGDPRENAIAERVNGILKKEFIELMDLTEDNAEAKLKEIINTYNSMRPHLSLGYFTPDEAHHMNGEQIRLWKPYYYKSRDMSEKNDTFADANNMDDDHLDRYPP